jgi:hypothetical protein
MLAVMRVFDVAVSLLNVLMTVVLVVAALVTIRFARQAGADSRRAAEAASKTVAAVEALAAVARDTAVASEGDAVQVTDDAALGRLAAAFTAKWDGRWQFAARGGAFGDPGDDSPGQAQVFTVRPVKVFAHAKGDPFGVTRYRF